MELRDFFPIWNQLTAGQQEILTKNAIRRTVPKGTPLHTGMDCTGLLLVEHGQLRAYILSEDGREITLYRLLMIKAEKDTMLCVIPADLYKEMMEHSAALANYTNEIMAARFSEVMWLLEQILWRRFDQRLAGFLLEESALEGTDLLKITHEAIGSHLGNPREVVTRMLRYFQSEGLVKLTRGNVAILDERRLRELSST